jgi:hypothetical protein
MWCMHLHCIRPRWWSVRSNLLGGTPYYGCHMHVYMTMYLQGCDPMKWVHLWARCAATAQRSSRTGTTDRHAQAKRRATSRAQLQQPCRTPGTAWQAACRGCGAGGAMQSGMIAVAQKSESAPCALVESPELTSPKCVVQVCVESMLHGSSDVCLCAARPGVVPAVQRSGPI